MSQLLTSIDFGGAGGLNLGGGSELELANFTLPAPIAQFGVVVDMRNLSTDQTIRELRVYLDDLIIKNVEVDNVPVNQSDRYYPEDLGLTSSRMSAVIVGIPAGAKVVVKARSESAEDSTVHGTVHFWNLDTDPPYGVHMGAMLASDGSALTCVLAFTRNGIKAPSALLGTLFDIHLVDGITGLDVADVVDGPLTADVTTNNFTITFDNPQVQRRRPYYLTGEIDSTLPGLGGFIHVPILYL